MTTARRSANKAEISDPNIDTNSAPESWPRKALASRVHNADIPFI
jgi:hypothetical protein